MKALRIEQRNFLSFRPQQSYKEGEGEGGGWSVHNIYQLNIQYFRRSL